MTQQSTVVRVADMIATRDPKRAEQYLQEFGTIPDNSSDEIFQQNRYWRRQLGALRVNTISERECLLDTLDPEDWMRHFSNHVMPTVHRYELPQRG